jgi:hypothetical protein
MFGISLLVGAFVWLAYFFYGQHEGMDKVAKPSQVQGIQSHPADRGLAHSANLSAAPPLSSLSPNTQGVAVGNATLATLFSRIEETLRELAMLYGFVYTPSTTDYTHDDLMYQSYQPQIDNLQQHFEALKQQASGISASQTQRFLWEQLQLYGLGSGVNSVLFDAIGIPEDKALLEEMLAAVASPGYPVDDRLALFQGVFMTHGHYYDYSGVTGQPQAKPSVTPTQLRLKQFLEEQFQVETNPALLGAYLDFYHNMVEEGGQVSVQQFQQQLDLLRMQLGTDQYFDFRLRALNMQDANADYTSLLQEIDSTRMTSEERERLMTNLAGQLVGFLMPLVYNADAKVELPARTREVFQQYLETHLPTPSLQNDLMLYRYATEVEGIYLLRYGKYAPEHLYAYLLNGASLDAQVALLGSGLFQDEQYRNKFQQANSLKQGIEQALTQPNLTFTARNLLENARIRLEVQAVPPPPSPEEMGVDENGNPVSSYYTGEGNTTPDGAGVNPETRFDIVAPVGQSPGY